MRARHTVDFPPALWAAVEFRCSDLLRLSRSTRDLRQTIEFTPSMPTSRIFNGFGAASTLERRSTLGHLGAPARLGQLHKAGAKFSTVKDGLAGGSFEDSLLRRDPQ